jgi:hypothetical protein
LTLGRGDNTRAFTGGIRWTTTAASGNAECCQPVSVEARHQIGHRRAAPQAGLACRVDKDASLRHRQQRGGSAHLVDSVAATLDDLL